MSTHEIPAPLRAAFEAGLADGRFPRAAADTRGRTGTTTTSSWLGLRCTRCHHTFRRGDLVLADADPTRVRHLDPALGCAAPPPGTADAADADTPDDFVEGLLAAWPTITRVPVFVLGPDDPQVTTPDSGRDAPTCPVCGHTFRAGDTVVVCACADGLDDERRSWCRYTVHRAPDLGLTCWDDWAPTGRRQRCPRTLDKADPAGGAASHA